MNRAESRTTAGSEIKFPLSVCVVGLGYIGLPTASILASRGHSVLGVDICPDVVDTVNRGEIHFHEPDLADLVNRVVRQGRLKAALEPQPADVFFLCVPTPITNNRQPDLRCVEEAARAIRPHVRQGNLIILESTCPPQTTVNIVAGNAVPAGLEVGKDVFVAYGPERVLPGRILTEVVQNDRVVGGVTPACAQRAKQFYQSFVEGSVMATNAQTAELVKLVENSYRDVNIALANELSMLADRFGVDVFEVIELANRHPRVNILTPGPGVGGHCISIDPLFLVHAAPLSTRLIRTARQVNDRKIHHVVRQIESMVEKHNVRSVGCLGLAYKADVDDLRQSPSLEIVRQLRQRLKVELRVCDPYLSPTQFGEFQLHTLDDVLESCRMLVLLTDHTQFRDLPAAVLEKKLILDTRGCWRTQRHLSTGVSQLETPRRAA